VLRTAAQLVRRVFPGRSFLNCTLATGTSRISRSRRRWAFIVALAMVIAAFSLPAARAQGPSYWNTGSGSWGVAANWNPTGVPTDTGVFISENDSVNRVVTYDVLSSGATYQQLVEIDQIGSGSNTLTMNANTVLSTGELIVGENGEAEFINAFFATNTNYFMIVGDGVGSSGTYSNSGTLTMTAGGLGEVIGNLAAR
jgi:hypothetical protein